MAGILAGVVLSAGCANWTIKDTVLQGGAVAMIGLDGLGTGVASNMGAIEMNPILGRHPDSAAILSYTLVAAALHTGVSMLLSGNWRTAWQFGTIGVEGVVVGWSYAAVRSHVAEQERALSLSK